MSVNKDATRYASSIQESRVAKKFDGVTTVNSGAGKFSVGDVVVDKANMLIECKTCMSEKDSFSIKKSWLDKQKQEAFAKRYSNYAIAFNFYYEDKNDYYVINDRLFRFLLEKLSEEEQT